MGGFIPSGFIRFMFILLSLCPFCAWASDEGWDLFEEGSLDQHSLSSTEGLLSSIIASHVSAISGEFVDNQIDCTLAGPEPLSLQRSYSSHPSVGIYGFEPVPVNPLRIEEGKKYCAWQFNHLTHLHFQVDVTKQGHHGQVSAFVPHAFFSQMLHRSRVKISEGEYKRVECTLPLVHQKGVTNCSSGAISGRTNPKNVSAHFHREYKVCDVTFGSGDCRHYEGRPRDKESKIGTWKFTPKDEIKANGSQIIYQKGLVSAYSPTGSTQYGSLKFHWISDQDLQVETSHTQPLYYHYEPFKVKTTRANDFKKRFYLTSVQRPDQADESYEYTQDAKKEGWLLSRICKPDQRFLEIEYYGPGDKPGESLKTAITDPLDPRLNRVKCLKAPIGVDGAPIVTHRFFYDLNFRINQKKKKVEIWEGITTVYDALNRKTIYAYNQYHRLEKLIQYMNDKPYAQTKYVWEDVAAEIPILDMGVFTFRSGNQGNLMGKIVQDAKGNILTGRFFTYDRNGNILTERIYGNLTGASRKSIVLDQDQHPVDNGAEFYERTFAYSNDRFNLLLEESEPNGRSIKYLYVPESDLISGKFLCAEGKICAREFYEYEDNNAVAAYISDNGSGTDRDDFTDVTERHITRYQNRKEMPVGLPECIEEKYLDLASGQEVLMKRTEQTFSPEGRLLEKRIVNAAGEYCYALVWEYDSHGNMIKQVNALQQTIIRKYDDNDNLVHEQGPSPEFYTVHQYDYANRRIATEEIHINGERFTTHYRYDLAGNCIAKSDRCGNEITYLYDDLNRLTATVYPEVDGEKERASEKRGYDCLGNVVEDTNASGFTTKKRYNTRGKVILIEHPDGQLERYEYALDGSLKKKFASNGTTTSFKVDCLGRVLNEKCHSKTGALLYELYNTYDSLHKTSSTDAMGLTTNFFYDGAGRLIKTTCLDKSVLYEYDQLGRRTKKIETVDLHQVKVSCREYDLLDRLIEEWIEDDKGNILKKASYAYDLLGNRTRVTEETQAGTSTHITLYNSDKKPVKTIDPEGNETHIDYSYAFRNSLDQLVLQSTTTDPLGRQTIVTYDALERPVKIRKRDPFGLLLTHQDIFYDPLGHIVRLMDHVVSDGKEIRTIETEIAYEKMGQISLLVLAKGLPEQQVTKTEYDAHGRKETLIKPDGTLIHYRYDSLGRLSAYFSSDGTLSYQYHYNPRHQTTKVEDLIAKNASLFEYDAKGRMIQEILPTSIALAYEYDHLDRVTALILPDSSRVVYHYDAINLKQIERMKNSKSLYAYRYDAYDQSGLNLQSTSIYGHQIAYAYDLLKRPVTVASELNKCTKAYYDQVGRLQSYVHLDAVGTLHPRYGYDGCDHVIFEEGEVNHTYTCDSLHNRLTKDQRSYTSNGMHQLLHNEESTFTYDLAGNLIRKQKGEETTTYRYDAADRLIAVKLNEEACYHYDAFHRRIAKVKGNKTTRYLYVGQDEIGSIDEAGNIQELRVLGQGYGAEIGATIAVELNGQVFAPSHDFRGNITALSDHSGKVIESYRYSTFGETAIYNAEGRKIDASLIGNPWRFSSKRADEESGLLYFGRRYYDPYNGRWITADPAGLADGPNLYAYLHHSPLNAFDLYGLQEEGGQGQQAPYYPLQNVEYGGRPDQSQTMEDALPNETPLGFMEKKAGKKSKMYWCGFSQIAEMGMGFMNGIMNKLKDAYAGAKALSEMANDHYVTFVHNESHGFLYDVIRSACELFFYMNTKSVKNLQKKWDAFFDHASPDSFYYHECHSEGAIITRNALMSYPEELRKRIIVTAFAPAAYIDDKYAYEVTHYRSTRDIVPLIDFVGAFRCRDSTVVLTPHPDAPWFDHSINSPTYHDYRLQHISNYCQKYGGSICAQPA